MPEQMKNFIILISAIAVVLVIVVLFCGNKKVRKAVTAFLTEETDDSKSRNREERQYPAKQPVKYDKQKKSSQPQIEMATLVRKSDDRRRIIESTGQTKIEDEFYELVFKSRKGRTIILECSRNAYNNIPFNQQGSLTYRREKLIKFKYFGGIIHNDD